MRNASVPKAHFSPLCAALYAVLASLTPWAMPTPAFAEAETDTAVSATQPEPLLNWEAYALVDKNFQALDCENIGEFPPEEIDDHMGQVWLPVTAGQTQELSPRVYAKVHHGVPEASAARLFADADLDGDGKVTPNELRDQFVRLIVQLDLNDDRWLTRAELDQSEPGQPFSHLVGADAAGGDGESQPAAPTKPTATADAHQEQHQHQHDHSAHE